MGKTAVVKGCTGGMGQILCRKLAEMGYDLGLCSNMRAELEAQAALLVQTDVKEMCIRDSLCIDARGRSAGQEANQTFRSIG